MMRRSGLGNQSSAWPQQLPRSLQIGGGIVKMLQNMEHRYGGEEIIRKRGARKDSRRDRHAILLTTRPQRPASSNPIRTPVASVSHQPAEEGAAASDIEQWTILRSGRPMTRSSRDPAERTCDTAPPDGLHCSPAARTNNCRDSNFWSSATVGHGCMRSSRQPEHSMTENRLSVVPI